MLQGYIANCKAAHIWVMLIHITPHVRNASVIGRVAWANTANTQCVVFKQMLVSPETAPPVSGPHSHAHCFSWSPGTHLHSCTRTNTSIAASPRSRWSQIRAKHRQWGRAIGSCQTRPHYQPLTARLLCSSIMTSRCTCLSAWPPLHMGTQVRLNIAILSLSHCCRTLHRCAQPTVPPPFLNI